MTQRRRASLTHVAYGSPRPAPKIRRCLSYDDQPRRRNNRSLMTRDVGVKRRRHGFRHSALSISFRSPMRRMPLTLDPTKTASFIRLPEIGFLPLTCPQSRAASTRSAGSSSRISRCRQRLALSPERRRPPGKVQRPSCRRRTSSTRPLRATTSLEDFAIRQAPPSRRAPVYKVRRALWFHGDIAAIGCFVGWPTERRGGR